MTEPIKEEIRKTEEGRDAATPARLLFGVAITVWVAARHPDRRAGARLLAGRPLAPEQEPERVGQSARPVRLEVRSAGLEHGAQRAVVEAA